LIIGGGMAADSAAQAIREIDSEGTIGIISKENSEPYARPLLSKGLWKGEEEVDDIYLGTAEVNVEFHLNQTVTKINPDKKKAFVENGDEYSYEKLLISTGGTPKEVPNVKVPGIIYYRSLVDFETLREKVDERSSFGVIGGGFIGSEIAAGIKMYKPDAEITIIFPEYGIGGLIFPEKLSKFLNEYYQEQGITVLSGELVSNITKQGEKYLVETNNGKKIEFDVIVAGLGINPNTKLAEDMKLEVDDGIVVNKFLQTSNKDIFAAGDVVRYYVPSLDTKVRVEHEDNAIYMGWTAGQNMAGQENEYYRLSYFYSDLFDYGYEAVGLLDPKLKVEEVWKEPLEEGILYYLKDDRVKGILLWNVWDKVEEARLIISDGKKISRDKLEKLIEY
jgi:3-phenylpropionate/trans-cinnamate dioxygenase ferredoxin reductase subunit